MLAFVGCNTYDGSLLSDSQGATNSVAGASNGGGVTGLGGSLGTGGNAGVASVAGGTANVAGSVGSAGSGNAGGMGSAGGPGGAGGAGGSSGSGGSTSSSGASGSAGSSAASGFGGVSSGGTGGSVGGTGGTPGIEMIDDFEDLNTQILVKPPRNGYWYVFNDGTVGGTQSPLTVALLPTADARAGSTAALHMTAQGFTTNFGAGVGADFVTQGGNMKVAYNVSAYRGIQFYAKVATGTETAVKVLIPTTYSDAAGGKCSGSGTSQCGDHFYYPVTAKATWDVYVCDFSGLTQQGFGLVQTSFDPATVYSVQFTLANTAALSADIWIDDVAFVLK